MALTPIKEQPGEHPEVSVGSTTKHSVSQKSPTGAKQSIPFHTASDRSPDNEANEAVSEEEHSETSKPAIADCDISNGVIAPATADSTDQSQQNFEHVACHSNWKRAAHRALVNSRRDVAVKVVEHYNTRHPDLPSCANEGEPVCNSNNNFLTVESCYRYSDAAGTRGDTMNHRDLEKCIDKSAPDGAFHDLQQNEDSSCNSKEGSPLAPPIIVAFFDKIGTWKQYIVPLGYALVTILYAIFGGSVYHAIEYPAEVASMTQSRFDHHVRIKTIIGNITQLFEQYGCVDNNNSSSSFEELNELLENYHRSAGHEPSSLVHWTFAGSVWFAITIFTTIGYGNYVPVTTAGKVFTMIYALFGIPLVLLTLGEVGKLFTMSLKKAYNHTIALCHRTKRRLKHSAIFSRRRQAEISANGCAIRNQSYLSKDDDDFSSIYTDNEWVEFDFPIPFALSLIIGWILLVSLITWSLGDFDFFSSIYFWFISFTTIGLGDYTPTQESTAVLFIPIFFVGLALISMVITLLQSNIEKMEDIVLEDYLGWDTESAGSNSSEDENDPDEPTRLSVIQEDKHQHHGPKHNGSARTSASTLSGQPMTLGIFQASGDNNADTLHKPPDSHSPIKLKRALSLWTKEQPKSLLASTSVNLPLSGKLNAANQANSAAIKCPKNIAKVLEMQKLTRTERRVRRGVQTDESHVFENKIGKHITWKEYKKLNRPLSQDEDIVEYFDDHRLL